MRLWRRRRRSTLERLPPARRLWPTTAEAKAIRTSFLRTDPDGVEVVLTFGDDGPDYAVQLDEDLARHLMPALEAAMTAIEPLMAEDVSARH